MIFTDYSVPENKEGSDEFFSFGFFQYLCTIRFAKTLLILFSNGVLFLSLVFLFDLVLHLYIVCSFVYHRMNKFLINAVIQTSKVNVLEIYATYFFYWNPKYALCWVMQHRLRRHLARVEWILWVIVSFILPLYIDCLPSYV